MKRKFTEEWPTLDDHQKNIALHMYCVMKRDTKDIARAIEVHEYRVYNTVFGWLGRLDSNQRPSG